MQPSARSIGPLARRRRRVADATNTLTTGVGYLRHTLCNVNELMRTNGILVKNTQLQERMYTSPSLLSGKISAFGTWQLALGTDKDSIKGRVL